MADSADGRPARAGKWWTGITFGILIWLIAGPGLGSALIFQSVQLYGQAALSSYTQAHGVLRAAGVISDDTSGGKNPTSALAVRLSRPVNGRDTTTVHIQGAPTYSPGESVIVVVDPQDPGYAELDGARYTSSALWVVFLGGGLAAILFCGAGLGVGILRQLTSGRRLRRFSLR